MFYMVLIALKYINDFSFPAALLNEVLNVKWVAVIKENKKFCL